MLYRSLLLILIVPLAIGGCSSDDADTEPSPETTVNSTTAPATTVAATSQELVLTFDGDQCTYLGPSVGDLSESFSFTLVNDSDLTTLGSVYFVPPEAVDEMMETIGTDFPAGTDPIPGVTQALMVEAPSGDEQSLSNVALPAPGTYVLGCTTADGATRLHVWLPAAVEVS